MGFLHKDVVLRKILWTIWGFYLAIGCSPGIYTQLGLSGTSVYVVSETAPEFEPSRSQYTFHIFVPSEASVADKKLAYSLRQAMQLEGFKLTDSFTESDIIVCFWRGFYEYKGTLYLPFTVRKRGHLGMGYGIPYEETEEQLIPYEYSKLHRQININMYLRHIDPVTGEVTFDHVWYGYLDIEPSAFDKHPSYFLSRLLSFFGKDYKAHERWTLPKPY